MTLFYDTQGQFQGREGPRRFSDVYGHVDRLK